MREQVVPLRPTGFELYRVLGKTCSICGHPDLSELGVHRIGCELPYRLNDLLRACACGGRIAHVLLRTRGSEWLSSNFELRCANCAAKLGGIDYGEVNG